jgi:ech hydrogenase subunit A
MEANTLIFLILFPFLAAIGLLITPRDKYKTAVGILSAVIIFAASIFLLAENLSQPAQYFNLEADLVEQAMLAIELLIALYIIYMSVKYKQYTALVLSVLQTGILFYFELNKPHGATVANNLFIDQLSLVMALIIGIIGSLICVYAFGYMRDFHHSHKEVKDRRNIFFFILFTFLSAMFGLVFSNNIVWVYFFWEVTTICSFILIKYTENHEAVSNAFKALNMNLLGGFAFALALLYLGTLQHPLLSLSEILQDSNKLTLLIPAMLIGFAGLTKSAQMPFSSWLVGAMVAPTPVSALLHSSTMVKAGVYIIVRFAPLYEGSFSGLMLSLIGGLTFLLASAIAISQSNAKKVLAYSTIANLGLIVACGGVGTYEAVWAAIMLIIFHAIAKSLMFLSVGTVEHRISSRDIEDMEGLITRMPGIAVMMLIGIAGMFLAPFGMLISKWATLKAFIDSDPILVGMVAYGSGLTVFFWSKWMGKLIATTRIHKVVEDRINTEEWIALYVLTGLTIAVTLSFPWISLLMVEPFLMEVYGKTTELAADNIIIMFMMMGLILLMPFSILYYRKERKHLSPYMAGMTTTSDMKFTGALGAEQQVVLKNYYLNNLFGEEKVVRFGTILCVSMIILMFISSGPILGVFT